MVRQCHEVQGAGQDAARRCFAGKLSKFVFIILFYVVIVIMILFHIAMVKAPKLSSRKDW
jgi:hypothetical protein